MSKRILPSIRTLLAENVREQRAYYEKAARQFAHAQRLITRAQKAVGKRQKAALKQRIAQPLYDTADALRVVDNLEWMRRVFAGS